MTRATCSTCLRSLALTAMHNRGQGGATCRQCALGKRAAALHARIERLPDPLNLIARAWRHPVTAGALTPTT